MIDKIIYDDLIRAYHHRWPEHDPKIYSVVLHPHSVLLKIIRRWKITDAHRAKYGKRPARNSWVK